MSESLTVRHERLKKEFTRAFYDYASYKISLKDLQKIIFEYLEANTELIEAYKHVLGRTMGNMTPIQALIIIVVTYLATKFFLRIL